MGGLSLRGPCSVSEGHLGACNKVVDHLSKLMRRGTLLGHLKISVCGAPFPVMEVRFGFHIPNHPDPFGLIKHQPQSLTLATVVVGGGGGASEREQRASLHARRHQLPEVRVSECVHGNGRPLMVTSMKSTTM